MKKFIKRQSLVIIFILLIIQSTISVFAIEGEVTILKRDQQWHYFDKKKDLKDIWLTKEYDYSNWDKGNSPLGFGDLISETDKNVKLATEVGFGGDENDKQMTTYFKTKINIKDLKNYKNVKVFIHVDDGAVVYFNGKEAFRKGLKENEDFDYNTPFKFKPKEEIFYIDTKNLKEGENIISAEVHQSDNKSSDLWFEMEMSLTNDLLNVKDYSKTELPNLDVEVGDVSRVTVTFNGNTENQKGFTWYTNQRSINSDLHIIEKKDGIDFTNPIKYKGDYIRSTNAPEFIVHKALATNLKANSEYYFRVGDEELNIWSEVGTFKTSEEGYGDGKFTFIDLADSQAKNEDEAILSAETFKKANETSKNSEFMIINGDIVDTGVNEEQWGWVLDHSKYSLLNTTIVPAAGNHDDGENAFIEHFNISTPKGSKTDSGAYYSYDYENTHFVVLNNNEDSKEYRNFTTEQVEWLKEDIKKAKTNNKIKWIIAVMHKGPYTTSNHGTDEDIINKDNGVRYKIAPLLNELGVDLVLQGHDHIYARSKPIKNNRVGEFERKIEKYNDKDIEYIVNPDGTIYLIPSTAGPKVYYKNQKLDDNYYNLFDVANEHSAAKYGNDEGKNRPKRSQVQNFIEFNIDGNKLTGKTYEIDQNINNKEPFVVDIFGIIKDPKIKTKIDSIKYRVKRGDTLWRIAKMHNLDYKIIQKNNGIKNANLIYAGEYLEIPRIN